jgi:hypothetical protein
MKILLVADAELICFQSGTIGLIQAIENAPSHIASVLLFKS